MGRVGSVGSVGSVGRWGDGEMGRSSKSRARGKRQELIKYSAASLLPIPCSLFPIPCSLLRGSLLPKNMYLTQLKTSMLCVRDFNSLRKINNNL
ncbi:MAG: hypothetical protein F6K56_31090 [Moorea sp. SIO3G5]|nr:hypothetical protein [Moorena sp. SIO3G5]